MRFVFKPLILLSLLLLLNACGADAEYTGEEQNKKPHGEGTWLHPGGTFYSGEFVAGLREGHGTWEHRSGIIYRGGWKENRYHGTGTLKIPGRLIYTGQWYYGLKEGYGVQEWLNGEKYVGFWQNNLRHGQGIMHYADGSVYEGNWEEGKRSGEGVLTTAEGEIISGIWEKDRLAYIPVSEVRLNREALTLNLSSSGVTLTAAVFPEEATNKSVIWGSENPSIASVNEEGLVVPLSPGSTTINATSLADGLKATCAIEVRAPSQTRATGITISPKIINFYLNSAPVTLTATVSPANASNQSVIWQSSNEAVVKVNDDGQATPRGYGDATITALTADGGHAATCLVIVYNPELDSSFD
jgi:uncharacterized protein YjdB